MYLENPRLGRGVQKKLIAIRLEKRTPFDYNRFAATNCKKNQKEDIQSE